MNEKIYYIETTLNGYIIKEIEIADWTTGIDYSDKLVFDLDGNEVDYYEEIAGMMNDIDIFLKTRSNDIDGYKNEIGIKSNYYLEYWLTNSLGYYDNKYVGLAIK